MAKKKAATRADKTDRSLRKVVNAIAAPAGGARKEKGDARSRIVKRRIEKLVTREQRRLDRNS